MQLIDQSRQVEEEWQPSSLMWEAAWAHKLSRGQISRSDAVKLVTTNVEDLFNLPQHASSSSEHLPDFVAYEVSSFLLLPHQDHKE